jgi:hypothetical protein
MSIAVPLGKRSGRLVVGLSAFFLLCYLALPFLQFSVNWTRRFVTGQHPFGGHSIHSASHEPLPSVVVESGYIVCCRMDFCDFRFPLPKGAGVVSVEPVSGGFDTIKGAIYVTNANGGPVDLGAYSRRIWEAGFRVNRSPDIDMFGAGAPDGGGVEVWNSEHSTKIGFSFFGDY